MNNEIQQLIEKLECEINQLAQVNETWTEQQRGPVSSLRFRRYDYWEDWRQLSEMLDDWENVTPDTLRSCLLACRIRLIGGLEEALSLWTDEERQRPEWLELDPQYEQRIALIDSILEKL